jgi:DNA modification methylase
LTVTRHELAPDLVIYEGDVLDGLRQMPDGSVQCVATSPPYWGLRNYNLPPSVWGGDKTCDHEWTDTSWRDSRKNDDTAGPKQRSNLASAGWRNDTRAAAVCSKCDAWRGCLGLEPTPDQYVANLVEVFREVRRVLRSDGVLWLNIGDSFSGSGVNDGTKNPGLSKAAKRGDVEKERPNNKGTGLPNKNLCFIPERVAMALQADGWYVRAKPPWIKGNPMPESVTDRPGSAHESIFLLSKSANYFYDPDAVRVPAVSTHGSGNGFDRPESISRGGAGSDKPWVPKSATFKREGSKREQAIPGQTVGTHRPDREDTVPNEGGRYRRTNDWWNESLDIAIEQMRAYLAHMEHVKEHGGLLLDTEGDPLGFMVNTKPFKEAHFAVWPEDLVEPMILAGTSPQACPHCGAPWARTVEKDAVESPASYNGSSFKRGKTADPHLNVGQGPRYESGATVGWQPTCSCENDDGSGKCVVLDPFGGSMTTIAVAVEHGRAGIACELSSEYIQLGIRARLSKTQTSLLGRL